MLTWVNFMENSDSPVYDTNHCFIDGDFVCSYKQYLANILVQIKVPFCSKSFSSFTDIFDLNGI
jgi:hypothetical protein